MKSLLIVLLALAVSSTASATAQTRFINLTACPVIAGPAPLYAWDPYDDFVMNDSMTETIVLFCDAAIPPAATAFDYAELEYSAPEKTGNPGVYLAAYAEERLIRPDGATFENIQELGQCGGTLSALNYESVPNLDICQTSGAGLALTQGGQRLAQSQGLSLFFLVFLQPSGVYLWDNWVVRIIVHYEQ